MTEIKGKFYLEIPPPKFKVGDLAVLRDSEDDGSDDYPYRAYRIVEVIEPTVGACHWSYRFKDPSSTIHEQMLKSIDELKKK